MSQAPAFAHNLHRTLVSLWLDRFFFCWCTCVVVRAWVCVEVNKETIWMFSPSPSPFPPFILFCHSFWLCLCFH